MGKIKLFVGLRDSGKTTALKKEADGKKFLYVKNKDVSHYTILDIINNTNVTFDFILVDDISIDDLNFFKFSGFTKNEQICFAMTIDIKNIPKWFSDKLNEFEIIECKKESIFTTNNISQ